MITNSFDSLSRLQISECTSPLVTNSKSVKGKDFKKILTLIGSFHGFILKVLAKLGGMMVVTGMLQIIRLLDEQPSVWID